MHTQASHTVTTLLAFGPLGTMELIIIGALLLFMAAVAGGVVFLVIYLTKKK